MLFVQIQINRRAWNNGKLRQAGMGRWLGGWRPSCQLWLPRSVNNLIYFSVAKVIETVASSAQHIFQKTSSSSTSTQSASIVVSTHQPLTMATLTTTATPSSNSNLPAAVPSTPMKKQRPKTASPTRHGPQVCQVTPPPLVLYDCL